MYKGICANDRCSELCETCYGPTHADCLTCKQYKIYHDTKSNSKSKKSEEPRKVLVLLKLVPRL